MDEGINYLSAGTVTSNYDKKHPGMLRVALRYFSDENNQPMWLPVAVPYGGKEYGAYWLPEVGDTVLVGFLEGDLHQGIVLGSFWNEANTLPSGVSTEKNDLKTFQTKGGHILSFEDKEKGSVTLKTKKGFQIVLSEDLENIIIKDSKSENQIILDEKGSSIKIIAKSKVLVKSDTNIQLESNEISLKAKNIKLAAGAELSLEGKSVKLKGTAVKQEGTNFEVTGPNVKVESSGMLTLKGSMTKIN